MNKFVEVLETVEGLLKVATATINVNREIKKTKLTSKRIDATLKEMRLNQEQALINTQKAIEDEIRSRNTDPEIIETELYISRQLSAVRRNKLAII